MARDEALEHPLPAGMRDFLPEEAGAISALGRRAIEAFELCGYERVTLPAFEYAHVLERGLGALDAREVLRFVEPESGEVVALRPDLTPQIARLLATRLSDAPSPARLCYEGSIVRLRRERARRHRQIPQAGIELVGSAAPGGDLEVLTVASAAVKRAGLSDFVLDLGHAKIAGSLIERIGLGARARAAEALAAKDPQALERAAREGGLEPELVTALASLTEIACGGEVWQPAEARLEKTPAAVPLAELRSAWEAASAAGLAPSLSVDLGEIRDLRYYSGVTFQILAPGPGEPIGSGGRYDRLLEKFGAPRPAAGFAVALDNLDWALGRSRASLRERLLVSAAAAHAICGELRALGIACAPAPPSGAHEYARAWRYGWVLEGEQTSLRLNPSAGGAGASILARDPAEIAREISALLTATMGQP